MIRAAMTVLVLPRRVAGGEENGEHAGVGEKHEADDKGKDGGLFRVKGDGTEHRDQCHAEANGSDCDFGACCLAGAAARPRRLFRRGT